MQKVARNGHKETLEHIAENCFVVVRITQQYIPRNLLSVGVESPNAGHYNPNEGPDKACECQDKGDFPELGYPVINHGCDLPCQAYQVDNEGPQE